MTLIAALRENLTEPPISLGFGKGGYPGPLAVRYPQSRPHQGLWAFGSICGHRGGKDRNRAAIRPSHFSEGRPSEPGRASCSPADCSKANEAGSSTPLDRQDDPQTSQTSLNQGVPRVLSLMTFGEQGSVGRKVQFQWGWLAKPTSAGWRPNHRNRRADRNSEIPAKRALRQIPAQSR